MQSSEKAIGKYLYLEENMSTIKLRENILEPSCAFSYLLDVSSQLGQF
jgi:hypothetical protein